MKLAPLLFRVFASARDQELFGAEAMTAHGKLLDRFQAVRNLGSAALDLAHVAAGWADATLGFSPAHGMSRRVFSSSSRPADLISAT